MSVVYVCVVWKEKEREGEREKEGQGGRERETSIHSKKSTLLSVVEVPNNTVARLNMTRSHV